jgi:hypothetical protein
MLPAALPQSVVEKLGYYVYLYLDPADRTIFYVGKGQGNRALFHLEDDADSNKAAAIKRLKEQGKEPLIEILAHSLPDEETAFRLESAVIDLIGVTKLTNQVRGYHSAVEGRRSLVDLIAQYAPQPVEIVEPVILIRINQFFRYGMTEEELYEITRGIWKLGDRRKSAKFAFAVYKGIVREVYQINCWFPAGTLEYKTREIEQCDRWEFEGQVADEQMRKQYFNKAVSRYFPANAQNPIVYVNC